MLFWPVNVPRTLQMEHNMWSCTCCHDLATSHCCCVLLGRDNFLGLEADRALSVMCQCTSESRCITALLSVANHKTPTVRTKVASHLDQMVSGGGLRSTLLNNWSLTERLFK